MVGSEALWVVGLSALGVLVTKGVTGARWATAVLGVATILLGVAAGLYYPLRASGDGDLVAAIVSAAAVLLALGGLLLLRRRGHQHRDPWARPPGTSRPAWWRGRRL